MSHVAPGDRLVIFERVEKSSKIFRTGDERYGNRIVRVSAVRSAGRSCAVKK